MPIVPCTCLASSVVVSSNDHYLNCAYFRVIELKRSNIIGARSPGLSQSAAAERTNQKNNIRVLTNESRAGGVWAGICDRHGRCAGSAVLESYVRISLPLIVIKLPTLKGDTDQKTTPWHFRISSVCNYKLRTIWYLAACCSSRVRSA